LVGRMGVKRPETGSTRGFLGEYATWPVTAQLLFENRAMSRVAVHPSAEWNRRNLIDYINLRRKHGAANFGKSRKNVASRSILVPAEWGVQYPEQRGASTAGPAPTIVGRAMWEVKHGALGVGHEKSGLWWRKRLGKGQSQGAKSVKPPPPWNSLLWDDAMKTIRATVQYISSNSLRWGLLSSIFR